MKVFLGLTRDLFALFIQQWDNISTDTERRAGLSTIAEPLVYIIIHAVLPFLAIFWSAIILFLRFDCL